MNTPADFVIVEPTGRPFQRTAVKRTVAARLRDLEGATIAVISAGSPTSPPEALDPFCEELKTKYQVGKIIRVNKKATVGLPKEELEKIIAEAQAAIVGVGV